ncbi:MAG TPA: flagellar hook-basal body complex protein [Tepidisphaeraceae bacterium]|jgi:flagellar hook protein FlgE|nr:flagellar hook-basal body complex protein [Tepidisphaeraceae bacterium]
MGLSSTLFTGLSGLDTNQTKLNVVGNNIANVNTVAFKASRALFKPQFYVTDAAGSPPSDGFGGENPSQRGLGAVVASIEKDWSPGSLEPTGKPTDLAIDGDGFFIVQGKEQKFTRDGSFTLNSSNDLVTTSGDYVQGFAADETGNIIAGALGNINIPMGSLTKAQATENAAFQGNLNADGAVASGASILKTNVALTDVASGTLPTGTTLLSDLRDESNPAGPAMFAAGDVLTLSGKQGGRDLPDLTYTVTGTSSVDDLDAFFNQGLGIDPLSTFTNFAGTSGGTYTDTTGALTANGSFLTITGLPGAENALSLSGSGFTSTNSNMTLSFSDTGTPAGESVSTSFVTYDSLGTPLTVNMTAVLDSKSDTGTTWQFLATSGDDTDYGPFDPTATGNGMRIGSGTLTFDSNGKLTASTGGLQIDRNNTGADTPLNVAMDFSGMTSLTSSTSQLLMSSQDGRAIGTLTSFSVGANGIITGAFDNGLTSTLGQVAMATFDNVQGLTDQGGNMFTTGANSGVPKITGPLTLTAGAIRSGALEQSNVDLSKEFINMIIASTGFTASSRVISTSDQLLTELLNTSR